MRLIVLLDESLIRVTGVAGYLRRLVPMVAGRAQQIRRVRRDVGIGVIIIGPRDDRREPAMAGNAGLVQRGQFWWVFLVAGRAGQALRLVEVREELFLDFRLLCKELHRRYQ